MIILEIKNFQNELSEFNIESTIKNNNEIYIICDKQNINERVLLLLKKYKLNFISQFCYETESNDVFSINIVLSNSKAGLLIILLYKTVDYLISFQDVFKQSHLFEREISDLYGLYIKNGVETRHLQKHEIWEEKVYPLRKSFQFGRKIEEKHEIPMYQFKTVKGEGVFQIPVGPIHAGIIEPGHFRFSAIGEDIENLETRLFYKHRGIEKIAENLDANKLNILFERIACESSVAYAESYALLIEKILEETVPCDVKALRVILLELERAYNLLDDIGGICVDVGFSYPAKKLSYMSEMIKQLAERVTGSRYMRNSIIPLGINIDFDKSKSDDIRGTLSELLPRIESITRTTLESFTFLDRVEHTGIINKNIAKKLMMTGAVGRASGVNYDVRRSFPYEIYSDIKKSNNLEEIGGVFERFKVKIAELKDSIRFVNLALDKIDLPIIKFKKKIVFDYGLEGFSIVETVKGALLVYGRTGKNNRFDRLYFKTPSFTNWEGITQAVIGEIVPDFPLCNKSLNMSYSENDR